ncbi:MAG: hypothetical protein JW712_13400 [Dehalococcoidales bacterium]|nr:hypothetical protein [Dehalococcoidales bacterium]
MNMRRVRKILHWLLLITTVIFLVSGLGISYFRVVETISFGLLSKSAAFHIHEGIWIPFVILLLLHVILSVVRKKPKWFRKNS